MSTCVYANCLNSRYKCKKLGRNLQFFRFPADGQIRAKWLQECGLDPTTTLKDHHRVCSEHFGVSDYGRFGGRRELLAVATPNQSISKRCILSTQKFNEELTIHMRFTYELCYHDNGYFYMWIAGKASLIVTLPNNIQNAVIRLGSETLLVK